GRSGGTGRTLQLHAGSTLASRSIGIRVSTTVSGLSDSSSLALDYDDILPDSARLELKCVHSLLESRLSTLQLVVEKGKNHNETSQREERDDSCSHCDLSRDSITRRGLRVLHQWVLTMVTVCRRTISDIVDRRKGRRSERRMNDNLE
ncbi:hypothetical protein PENTCL1PPCAC_26643, partial [Pristionchus entomophagus]